MKVVIALTALACVAALALAATPTPPVFPTSWTALEAIYVLEQGGVSTLTQWSYWQQDDTQNRTAAYIYGTSGPTLRGVVTDYIAGVDYYIDGGQCDYWCPDSSEICNAQDSLCTYDYVNGAKYVGTSLWNGTTQANEFDWMEGIGPIPMNALKLWVDANNNEPLFQYRDLEPFGSYIGYINTTFTNFQAGTPPASVFVVQGLQYCQEGDDGVCPDDVRERRRAKHNYMLGL